MYIYHIKKKYSFVNGHLDGFHILVIVKNAVMNVGMQQSLGDLDLNSYIPKSGMGRSMLSFQGTVVLFFIVVAPCCIPVNNVKFLSSLACAYPFPSNYFFFFDSSHTNRCEVISHCGFDLHFPSVKHLFMCLFIICILSLEKGPFKSFAH